MGRGGQLKFNIAADSIMFVYTQQWCVCGVCVCVCVGERKREREREREKRKKSEHLKMKQTLTVKFEIGGDRVEQQLPFN